MNVIKRALMLLFLVQGAYAAEVKLSNNTDGGITVLGYRGLAGKLRSGVGVSHIPKNETKKIWSNNLWTDDIYLRVTKYIDYKKKAKTVKNYKAYDIKLTGKKMRGNLIYIVSGENGKYNINLVRGS